MAIGGLVSFQKWDDFRPFPYDFAEEVATKWLQQTRAFLI